MSSRRVGILEIVPGDAHQRRHAHRQRGGADLRRRVERDRRMLHVDEEGVEAASLRDHADLGGAGEPRRHAQRHLAARKALLHAVGVRP